MSPFNQVYEYFGNKRLQDVVAITVDIAEDVKNFSKKVPQEAKNGFFVKLLNYFGGMTQAGVKAMDATMWARFSTAFSQIVNREYLYAETSEKKAYLLSVVDQIESMMHKPLGSVRAELQPLFIHCQVGTVSLEEQLIAKSQLQNSSSMTKKIYKNPCSSERNIDLSFQTKETAALVVQALTTGHISVDAVTSQNVEELFALGFANDFAPVRKACSEFLNRQFQLGEPPSQEFLQIMERILRIIQREELIPQNEQEAALVAKYQLSALTTRLSTRQGWETLVKPRGTEALLQHAKEQGFLPQFRPLSGRNAVETIGALFDMLTEEEADRFFQFACRPALNQGCEEIRPLLDAYLHRKIRQVLPMHDAVEYPFVTTKGDTLVIDQRSYHHEEKLYDLLTKHDLSRYYSSITLFVPELINNSPREADTFFCNQITSIFSSIKAQHQLPQRLIVRLCNEAMWAVGDPDLKKAWAKRTVDPQIDEKRIVAFQQSFERVVREQKRASFQV